MEMIALDKELKENSYPGRGIIIGRSADGTKAVTAYFIMGRSENSRNRVFVEDGEGIRTQAFDPSKLVDPSLIIYAPVRVLGNKTIVTNGDQLKEIAKLTPIKAIRQKCLDCCCGQLAEVRMCTCTTCALYGYRMGHRPKVEQFTIETDTEEKSSRSL